jgi:hypothetical protein
MSRHKNHKAIVEEGLYDDDYYDDYDNEYGDE